MREALPFLRSLNTISSIACVALAPLRRGYPGLFRQVMKTVNASSREIIRHSETRDMPIALFQGMIPAELGWALGVYPIVAEPTAYFVGAMAEPLAHKYLDRVEKLGVPSHTCSASRLPMGFILSGEYPKPDFIVATANPCDNLSAYYTDVGAAYPDVPLYRLDMPFLYDREAEDYYLEEMLRAIEWMEEVSGARLTESRLRAVVEEGNRAWEYVLALWDILKTPPAVFPAYWLWLAMPGLAENGHPRSTALVKWLYREARRSLSQGERYLPEERFRYVQWGLPTLYGLPLFRWFEEAYGAVMVSTMLLMIGAGPIDTTSMESMLRGICRNSRNSVMNTQASGPSERYTEDLSRHIREFNADLVVHFDHQGCKNTLGITSLFRNVTQELGASLCTLDMDAYDSRVVSLKGVQGQIETFMQTLEGRTNHPIAR